MQERAWLLRVVLVRLCLLAWLLRVRLSLLELAGSLAHAARALLHEKQPRVVVAQRCAVRRAGVAEHLPALAAVVPSGEHTELVAAVQAGLRISVLCPLAGVQGCAQPPARGPGRRSRRLSGGTVPRPGTVGSAELRVGGI